MVCEPGWPFGVVLLRELVDSVVGWLVRGLAHHENTGAEGGLPVVRPAPRPELNAIDWQAVRTPRGVVGHPSIIAELRVRKRREANREPGWVTADAEFCDVNGFAPFAGAWAWRREHLWLLRLRVADRLFRGSTAARSTSYLIS